MTAPEKSPADLLLVLVAAARWTQVVQPDTIPDRLSGALAALDAALQEEADAAGQVNAGHWHPATWADVKDGDHVRLGGQHEAEVETVVPLTWLGSGAAQVQVTLTAREAPYQMPPSGPVEVWKPSLPEWAARVFLGHLEGAAMQFAAFEAFGRALHSVLY